jgi:hypothetical protein
MIQKKWDSANINYLNRISTHDKIEDLADILKSFLKQHLNIKHEFTFEEIKNNIDKKQISQDMKSKISFLCEKFSELEYRPSKPSKKDIDKLKKLLKEIVKEFLPKPEETKKPILLPKVLKKTREIKKNKEKHKKIKNKVEEVHDNIHKNIIEKAKEKVSDRQFDIKKDKESREIARFISTSKKIGMKVSEIKKELKEMGFPQEKVDKIMKIV